MYIFKIVMVKSPCKIFLYIISYKKNEIHCACDQWCNMGFGAP